MEEYVHPHYSEVKVYTPSSLGEALKILDEEESAIIVAGATDVSVSLRSRAVKEKVLVDISRLKELKFVRLEDGKVKIGALTTHSECLKSNVLRTHAPLLWESISHIGTLQVRNLGTIGGNIGRASPSGDTLPPLYVLEANVILKSIKGERKVEIDKFVLGPGKTSRRHNELIAGVEFKPMDSEDLYTYRKLGLRRANAIAVASVAILIKLGDSGIVKDARIALGAVAPTVIRASKAEETLIGKPLTLERIEQASKIASESARPIDDIRGSAEYRKKVVCALAYQELHQLYTKLTSGVER